MKVKIQVVIESDDGRLEDMAEVACVNRGTLTPEELGLNLAEAKQILTERTAVDGGIPGRRISG